MARPTGQGNATSEVIGTPAWGLGGDVRSRNRSQEPRGSLYGYVTSTLIESGLAKVPWSTATVHPKPQTWLTDLRCARCLLIGRSSSSSGCVLAITAPHPSQEMAKLSGSFACRHRRNTLLPQCGQGLVGISRGLASACMATSKLGCCLLSRLSCSVDRVEPTYQDSPSTSSTCR